MNIIAIMNDVTAYFKEEPLKQLQHELEKIGFVITA